MRVLLIEHDPAYAAAIELMLKFEGINCYTTDEGAEGIELGALYDYDAIVLSTTPDVSEFDMVRRLRTAKVKAAIVVLSAECAIEAKVRALGTGADDYLTKPFHKDELIARIHATVRRSKGHPQSVIRIGDLSVNLSTKTVTVADNKVHLTTKEYGIVELLALRKNQTVTKEMLLNGLYGGLDEPELKIIDVFICKVRKKIGDGLIETVWGRGYVLRDTSVPKVAAPLVSNPVGRSLDGVDTLSRMVSA
jgi:two-component system, cell cycle response regulator CtrA